MTEMSPLEAIFFAALEQVNPADRAAYLDRTCAGDTDLRRQVEQLLAAYPLLDTFMEQPPDVEFVDDALAPPVRLGDGSGLEGLT